MVEVSLHDAESESPRLLLVRFCVRLGDVGLEEYEVPSGVGCGVYDDAVTLARRDEPRDPPPLEYDPSGSHVFVQLGGDAPEPLEVVHREPHHLVSVDCDARHTYEPE